MGAVSVESSDLGKTKAGVDLNVETTLTVQALEDLVTNHLKVAPSRLSHHYVHEIQEALEGNLQAEVTAGDISNEDLEHLLTKPVAREMILANLIESTHKAYIPALMTAYENMKTTGIVRGTVKAHGELISGAIIELQRDGTTVKSGTSGADGTYEIKEVLEGNYEVHIEYTHEGKVTTEHEFIKVKAGQVVTVGAEETTTTTGDAHVH